jgi:hypothetical protein
MWTHIVHTVTHWPWSTIAAFAAASAALWVARMQTREHQRLLERQTVVDVMAAGINYRAEGARYLAFVGRYLNGSMSAEELDGEPLERVKAAGSAMLKVLWNARIVCDDRELHGGFENVERNLRALRALFNESVAQSDEEQEHNRFVQIEREGRESIKRFGEAGDAFLKRGFEVYASRRALRALVESRRSPGAGTGSGVE